MQPDACVQLNDASCQLPAVVVDWSSRGDCLSFDCCLLYNGWWFRVVVFDAWLIVDCCALTADCLCYFLY